MADEVPTSTDDTAFPERPRGDPRVGSALWLASVADRQQLALRDIPAAGGVNSPDGKAILAARLELQRKDVPALLAIAGRVLEVEENAKILAVHVDYANRAGRVICTDCDTDLGPDTGTAAGWELHDRHVVELLRVRIIGQAP